MASMRRMEIALGVDSVETVAKRIAEMIQMKTPQGLVGKLKMLPKLAELGSFFPKEVRSGPCQDVVKKDGFSLYDYPVLTCWPQDGGPFITLPLVFSRNPVTGKRNCGMYRMQVYDERTTGMHWQTHKQGAEHYRRLLAEGKQERMEVAVAVGSDPATMFSAILPLPPDLDEMMFAGFLRGKPVEMVKCKTVDIEIPANRRDRARRLRDARRAAHRGTVRRPHRLLLARGRLSGLPRDLRNAAQEARLRHHDRRPATDGKTTTWARPSSASSFRSCACQLPEVVDMAMPAEGIFHNLMLVSIRKSFPGHARKVMNQVWGLGQAMFTKCIVVVDEDVNVHDYSEVAWKALNNIDPERDIQFTMGPIDSLDHSSRLPNYGSKMGVDATKKWPSGGFRATVAGGARDGPGCEEARRADLQEAGP